MGKLAYSPKGFLILKVWERSTESPTGIAEGQVRLLSWVACSCLLRNRSAVFAISLLLDNWREIFQGFGIKGLLWSLKSEKEQGRFSRKQLRVRQKRWPSWPHCKVAWNSWGFRAHFDSVTLTFNFSQSCLVYYSLKCILRVFSLRGERQYSNQ